MVIRIGSLAAILDHLPYHRGLLCSISLVSHKLDLSHAGQICAEILKIDHANFTVSGCEPQADMQYHQVREQMRMSKEALQKLGPSAAVAAQAANTEQISGEDPLEEDDNACIICLDKLSAITFHPCGHCVTCAACAMMVTNAKQPCPLYGSPVTSLHSWRPANFSR